MSPSINYHHHPRRYSTAVAALLVHCARGRPTCIIGDGCDGAAACGFQRWRDKIWRGGDTRSRVKNAISLRTTATTSGSLENERRGCVGHS